MIIGFLGRSQTPRKFSQCLNAFASLYNIEFFYFTEKRIDLESKTINGLFWDKDNPGKYIEKRVPYPDIIDDSAEAILLDKENKELRQHSLFLWVNLRNKAKVYDILDKEGHSKYLMNWYKYNDVNIDEILNIHNQLILKPNNAAFGNGIHKLSKENDLYSLQYKSEYKQLNASQFQEEYSEKFNNYLVQHVY